MEMETSQLVFIIFRHNSDKLLELSTINVVSYWCYAINQEFKFKYGQFIVQVQQLPSLLQ